MACEPCEQQIESGACKQVLKADCIYVTEELSCTGVQPNTLLTAALKRMDEVICEVKNKVAGTLALINIGGGAKIYEGLSNIGERQLRTLTSTDGTVSITEGAETIDFAVNITIPEVPDATEAISGISRRATQAEVDEGMNDTAHVTPLKLKTFMDENNNSYTLQVVGGNIELVENGTVVSSEALPMGNDTFIDGLSLTGTTLVVSRSDGQTFSQDISSLLNFTQVQSDFTQENPSDISYIKNRNPSKTVFADYVVKPEDNNYVIVTDSTNNPIIVTVPSTLPNKFTVGFVQKGTGLVTIANADIVPVGFTNTIRGEGHNAYVEKIEGTKFLFGNLNKAV